MKSRYLRFAAVLLALALLPALAMASPPSTRLKRGLWIFHYQSTVQMYGKAMTTHQSTRECIKNSNPGKMQWMRKMPPNIKCTAPTLQIIGKGYHVTMSCTANEPNGMVTHMNEDFLMTLRDSGSQMSYTGTVHQRITGTPVPIPATQVKISAQGHRLGPCAAPKH